MTDELPPVPDPLPAPALDSHCHLDIMGLDPGDVVTAARAVGIARVVTVGIDVPSSQWCADAAATYDGVHATVAIHPNESPRTPQDAFDEIVVQRRSHVPAKPHQAVPMPLQVLDGFSQRAVGLNQPLLLLLD